MSLPTTDLIQDPNLSPRGLSEPATVNREHPLLLHPHSAPKQQRPRAHTPSHPEERMPASLPVGTPEERSNVHSWEQQDQLLLLLEKVSHFQFQSSFLSQRMAGNLGISMEGRGISVPSPHTQLPQMAQYGILVSEEGRTPWAGSALCWS